MMRDEPFDDTPQWYWAAASQRGHRSDHDGRRSLRDRLWPAETPGTVCEPRSILVSSVRGCRLGRRAAP